MNNKILIVDDEPINIKVISEILSVSFDVLVATNSEDVFSSLERNSIDLILLDINMPKISGIELAKILKNTIAVKDIPIIFVTGHTDADTIVQAFEAGGADYITKPVNLHELLVRVDNQFKIKNLVNALNEQRNELESIFNHSTGSLIIVDLDFNILEVNETFKNLSQYDNFQGVNFFDIVDERCKEELEDYLDDLYEGENFENIQLTIKSKRGDKRVLDLSLVNMKNQDKILITIYDKTQLVEKERKIQETQERLLDTQKISKTVSWTLDVKSNNITFDKQVNEILEIDIIKRLTLNDFYDLVCPKDVTVLSALFQDAIFFGVAFSQDIRVVHEDSLKYYNIGCNIKYDENKNIIGLYGLIRDITENSIMLNNMKDYVNLIDKNIITSKSNIDGIITYASEAFCEISGYSKTELMGQNHSILRHPDMPQELYGSLWETIKSGKEWFGELKNRKKNGDDYWVEAHIYPEFDYKGEIIGYTAYEKR